MLAEVKRGEAYGRPAPGPRPAPALTALAALAPAPAPGGSQVALAVGRPARARDGEEDGGAVAPVEAHLGRPEGAAAAAAPAATTAATAAPAPAPATTAAVAVRGLEGVEDGPDEGLALAGRGGVQGPAGVGHHQAALHRPPGLALHRARHGRRQGPRPGAVGRLLGPGPRVGVEPAVRREHLQTEK